MINNTIVRPFVNQTTCCEAGLPGNVSAFITQVSNATIMNNCVKEASTNIIAWEIGANVSGPIFENGFIFC